MPCEKASILLFPYRFSHPTCDVVGRDNQKQGEKYLKQRLQKICLKFKTNIFFLRISTNSVIKKNPLYVELNQYEYNVYEKEDSFYCCGPTFFTLQWLINVIVFSHKLIPLLCGPILFDSCLILLEQQDGSLDNALCQKARLEILRGICPVANWTECMKECNVYYKRCIAGSNPFSDRFIIINCIRCILK